MTRRSAVLGSFSSIRTGTGGSSPFAVAPTRMQYQSPDDTVMAGQLSTRDRRDEHWILGYGL